MRARAAVSVYFGRPSPRVTTWKMFFWTQVLTHSDLGEEAKRKNDAVELADPEGVDSEGGGGEGPGEEGGVHSSFQGAGKNILESFSFWRKNL